MEAAGISADQALKPRTSEVIAEFISKYGLIALLIAFPAYYGIQDLIDDGNLTRIGNNLADGLSNGAIWALVALGYTLVYGIIELINFAHGEIFMIGAFSAFSLWDPLGLTASTGTFALILGLLVTLVAAMLVSGSLNVMIERVGYRPLRGAPKLALDTLKAVGDKANDREAVRKQLLENTKGRDSVLGTYDIDENGDTTLTDYGLYEIKNGQLEFVKAIKAEGG